MYRNIFVHDESPFIFFLYLISLKVVLCGFILNIVSANMLHENEIKQSDTNAIDLQEIKGVGQSFYFLTFL